MACLQGSSCPPGLWKGSVARWPSLAPSQGQIGSRYLHQHTGRDPSGGAGTRLCGLGCAVRLSEAAPNCSRSAGRVDQAAGGTSVTGRSDPVGARAAARRSARCSSRRFTMVPPLDTRTDSAYSTLFKTLARDQRFEKVPGRRGYWQLR